MRILSFMTILSIVFSFQRGNWQENGRKQEHLSESSHLLYQALGRNPQLQGPIYFNLGQVHLAGQHMDSAQYFFEQSLPLLDKKWSSEARNNLGYILTLKEKYAQALKQFRQALSSNPDNQLARYNYELAYLHLQAEADPSEKERKPKLMPSALRRMLHTPIGNQENGRHTYLTDSLSLDDIEILYSQLQEREKSFVQQLTRSPRKFLLSKDKPNW